MANRLPYVALNRRMWSGNVFIFFKICLAYLMIGSLLLAPSCSGSFFYTQNVNCSQFCKCDTEKLENVLAEYADVHSSLMGKDYRADANGHMSDPYLGFFGIALSVLNTIVKISCVVDDKRHHDMSELLNGADLQDYTYLDIKCMNHEEIFWDLPTWRTTINMFGSRNCHIKPSSSNNIKIPLNMWMFELYGSDQAQLENIDLTYATNAVSFVVGESELKNIPKLWSESYMLSVNTISLRGNELDQYQCDIPLARSLDTLNLDKNNLVAFPKCLLETNRVNVAYLALSGNKINDISALFTVEQHGGRIPEIQIINLSNNRIRKLDEFLPLPKLIKLDLSHNEIHSIQSNIFNGMTNLEHLSVAQNRIDYVAEHAFKTLEHLKILNLSGNKLIDIAPTILPVFKSELTTYLQNNELEHPPFSFCENNETNFLFNEKNYKFFVEGNPFRCDCSASPVAKCLNWLETKQLYDTFYMDIEQLECSSPAALRGKIYKDVLKQTSCIYTDRCPYGCSCTFKNEQAMIVNCANAGLKNIPDNIPTITSFSYIPNVILYLNNNKLKEIGYKPYFQHLVELYLHKSRIETVTPAALRALQHLKVLTLHENRMEKLPSSMNNLTFNQLENLTLHGNRWACSSDQKWLPKWMNTHKTTLFMPERIVCDSIMNQPILTLEEDTIRYNHLLCTIAAALITSAFFGFILKQKITEVVFVISGVRLMDIFSYGDVYSLYDAFVFYSQHDYKWVVETLVHRLEEGAVRYKLCLHFRDFPQNEIAMDNIPWAVRLSRCSILLLTNRFLKTEWQLPELKDIVVEKLLGSDRLIVVVSADVEWAELPEELQIYMSAHPFLRIGESDFWSKLLLYMPPPRSLMEDKPGDVSKTCGAGDQTKSSVPPEGIVDDAPSEAQSDEPIMELSAQDNTA